VLSPARPASPWLSLGEASRILGITPGTLRRWADEGQVATFVTPGGHRRFPRSVIESLVPHLRARRPALGSSADRMAQAYRRARPAERPAPPPWLASLSDADRADFRDRGHRLLACEPADLVWERDGRVMAACRDITLTADPHAWFTEHGSSFVGELAGIARRRRLDTREATALLVEAEAAMDRLLVALMNGYSELGR